MHNIVMIIRRRINPHLIPDGPFAHLQMREGMDVRPSIRRYGVYVFVCYPYAYAHIYTHTYTCICMSTHTCLCINADVYIHTFFNTSVHVHYPPCLEITVSVTAKVEIDSLVTLLRSMPGLISLRPLRLQVRATTMLPWNFIWAPSIRPYLLSSDLKCGPLLFRWGMNREQNILSSKEALAQRW